MLIRNEPFQILTYEDGVYDLANTEVHSMPVVIDRFSYTIFRASHAAHTQDHSPKLWVSKKPISLPKAWNKDFVFSLPKNGRFFQILDYRLISDPRCPLPYSFPVIPGTYWINVLNSEAAENKWQLKIFHK